MKVIALFLFTALHCISGEVDIKGDGIQFYYLPSILKEHQLSIIVDEIILSFINNVVHVNEGYISVPKILMHNGPFDDFNVAPGQIGNISDIRKLNEYYVAHHKAQKYYTLFGAFGMSLANYYSQYEIIHPEFSAQGNLHAEIYDLRLEIGLLVQYAESTCRIFIDGMFLDFGEMRFSLTGYESLEKAESAAKKLEVYFQDNKSLLRPYMHVNVHIVLQRLFDNNFDCNQLRNFLLVLNKQ